MENKEKVVNEEVKAVDFEKYSQDKEAVVTRGELADILGGLLDVVAKELDEVAQPALSVISAMNVLINVLKEKGIVTPDDFKKAEEKYKADLKEVENNG